MKQILIEVTLKRHIWIDKNEWENGFGEQLPTDMDDLEMLEDEASKTITELHTAKSLGEWIERE